MPSRPLSSVWPPVATQSVTMSFWSGWYGVRLVPILLARSHLLRFVCFSYVWRGTAYMFSSTAVCPWRSALCSVHGGMWTWGPWHQCTYVRWWHPSAVCTLQPERNLQLWLELCLARVDRLMAASRLKLNSEKSEIIWVGPKRTETKHALPGIKIGTSSIDASDNARLLDFCWSVIRQTRHEGCWAVFYQLRQLRSVHKSLDADSAATLSHLQLRRLLLQSTGRFTAISHWQTPESDECSPPSYHEHWQAWARSVIFLASGTSLAGCARTDSVQSCCYSVPLSSQHGSMVPVWNVHAHCYVSTSSGSSLSHFQWLSHSTCQTYDVWLLHFQRRRPSLLQWSTGLSQVTGSFIWLFQTSTQDISILCIVGRIRYFSVLKTTVDTLYN